MLLYVILHLDSMASIHFYFIHRRGLIDFSGPLHSTHLLVTGTPPKLMDGLFTEILQETPKEIYCTIFKKPHNHKITGVEKIPCL